MGYIVGDLRSAGFSLGELWRAGFDPRELRAVGFTVNDFAAQGMRLETMAAAKFTLRELIAEGKGFGPVQLHRDLGVSARDMLNNGMPAEMIQEVKDQLA